MSQCPHCRGLRKARASHVKCDCGEKPHCKAECPKQESPEHEKAESGSDHDGVAEGTSDPPAPKVSAPSAHPCCCSHGARCICPLKKDHLDPVPELDFNQIIAPPPRKPRLKTAQSETSLTVFTNHHHKPVHKHNDAAHVCGVPYKIPIPHSVPGKSEPLKEPARRSTDSLPLLKTMEPLAHLLQESISSAQQEVRLIKSEHGSPKSRALPSGFDYDGSITPLEMSFSPSHHGMPSSFQDEYGYQYFSPHEEPLLSAGIIPPIEDWSATDLPLDSACSASYSQPPSYASFDHALGQPGLTTSSSGEASEDDYMSQFPLKKELVTAASPDLQDLQDLQDLHDLNNAYRLSSASSFMSLPQASMLSDSNLSSHDIDSFLQATASPTDLEQPDFCRPLSSGVYARHGFTVQDAQKLAHPSSSIEAIPDLPALTTPIDELDSLWVAALSDEVSYDSKGTSATNVWAQ